MAEVKKRMREMFLKPPLGTVTGLNKAIKPSIRERFTMFEPKRLPMAMPMVSSETAEKEMAISGKEVAIDRSKNPRTISPNLVILAIFSAFLMVRSLEKERIAKNIKSRIA